jgi:signal transduction histidine kinase
MDAIRKVFVLPPTENEYDRQSAQVLQVIMAFLGCISVAYSVLSIVTDYPNRGRYAAQGGILLAFMLIGLIFLRKGYQRLVATVEILVIWLVFTAAAYTSGGVISSGYFGYLVVLVVAGVISGRRLDTIIVAIFCAGAGYYFVYAAAHGLLPPSRVPLTPFAAWIDSLMFFAVVTGLLTLTMRVTYNALLRINDELLERRRAETREQNRREMLEKVIRLGKVVTEVADYRTVLLRIWNGIRDELGFDRVGLFIYDASHDTMRGSFGTDRNGNFVEEWQLEFSASGNDFFAGVLSRPDSYYFTNDYEKERNLRPNHIMGGVKYYAAVSAWAGDKPVALICVDQLTSGHLITDEQLEALRFFAGYVGLAIENACLNADLEQRVKERTAELEEAFRLQAEAERRAAALRQRLLDFNQELLSSVDADEILEIIRTTADDLVPHDVFTPFWIDETAQTLIPVDPHGRKWFTNPFLNWPIPIGKGVIGDVARKQHPECVNNSHLDPRAIFPPGAREQIQQEHGIFLPVQSGDKMIGLLALIRHDLPPFTQDDFELSQLLLSQAKLALRNARMFAELEASNREIESFSYSVSHDLRAPLRAINGFGKILNNDFAAELSPPAQGFLKRIVDSGEKMGHLIDGLLDFSRLGRKPLTVQPVDVGVVVRLIIESLAAETAGRQIEWVFGELPPCRADRILIDQVFANLIGNAVKYTRKREMTRIEVGSFSQNSEAVYFVRDNGAGFDMQYANKLFGVFQRLHSENEFEGSGIGLATVQRIVQRHGGRIWAEAEVDKGATFYFTLG